jgi:3-oxoacyl-[acyl-carrier-protein] synthase-3
MNSKIIGTGRYEPAKKVSSAEMADYLNVEEEWIKNSTGIEWKMVTAVDELHCDTGSEAGRKAIEDAGIDPNDVEMIICTTSAPDRLFPATATMIQERLGCNGHCVSFDMGAACAGFSMALDIANEYIKSGKYKTVLVVSADSPHRFSLREYVESYVLFGDGAGAVVLQASDEPGIIDTHMQTDATLRDVLYTSPRHSPITGRQAEQMTITMDGSRLFKRAVIGMSKEIKMMLERNDMTTDDIDWFIPHQANKRIMDGIAKKSGLTDKMISTIDHHSNTSSPSIPLALDESIRNGTIKKGEVCLFVGFGAGFTWSSAIVTI